MFDLEVRGVYELVDILFANKSVPGDVFLDDVNVVVYTVIKVQHRLFEPLLALFPDCVEFLGSKEDRYVDVCSDYFYFVVVLFEHRPHHLG